jgi:hypothetical protein
MLLENDIKEHLALAYVYAVASRAGCSTELIRVDRNSVDVTVKHVDCSAGLDASLVDAGTRTVVIPRENTFDGRSLMRLMRLARRRETIR